MYVCPDACVSLRHVQSGSHNGVILSKCLVVTLPCKSWRKIIKVSDVDSDKDIRGVERFSIVLQQ